MLRGVKKNNSRTLLPKKTVCLGQIRTIFILFPVYVDKYSCLHFQVNLTRSFLLYQVNLNFSSSFSS